MSDISPDRFALQSINSAIAKLSILGNVMQNLKSDKLSADSEISVGELNAWITTLNESIRLLENTKSLLR